MLQKILAPLDGTAASEVGLAWARDAAARCGASIELLTVVDTEHAEANGHVQEAESYLRALIDRMTVPGVEMAWNVAVGPLGEQIVSHASEANLTVMTYHTRRWKFGGALDLLLRRLANPVVVIRGQEGQPASLFEVSKILVPVAEAERSRAALAYSIELCSALDAELVLCNVVSPIPGAYDKRNPPPEFAQIIEEQVLAAEAMMLSLATELGRQQVAAQSMIRVGEPAREIIAAAREVGAGLIAMTTRGTDSMSEILASIALGVAQASPIPCLLVRRTPPEPS